MITRRSRMGWMGIATALALAACGGSVETTTGGAGGASSSSGSANGGSAASTGTVGSTGSTGVATSSTASSGAGGGSPCGGFGGLTCAADEFCNYFDNYCGGNDGSGVCEKRPMGCPKNLDPVCACDGMIYDNACAANAAGVDVAISGNCTAPAGMFPCGERFCALGKQYCQFSLSDVGNEPDTTACLPLPAGCGPMPSCACLANEACGKMCSPSKGGGLTLTCPGG